MKSFSMNLQKQFSRCKFFVGIFFVLSFLEINTVQAQMLFDHDLRVGMQTSDVVALQQFLNRNYFPVAQNGPGSPGRETNYFGPATNAALIQFQKANNISPAVGFFGPRTRKIINDQSNVDTNDTSRDVKRQEGVTMQRYSISGSIAGVTGSVTLQNGKDVIMIRSTDNSAFTFDTKIASGDAYTISVKPNYPGLKCYAKNTVGFVQDAPVTNIKIACGIMLMYDPFNIISSSRARYRLDYSTESGGTLAGNANQTVLSGESGSAITAVPSTGYHFVAWSDGSTENPRTDRNGTRNISATANFAINTYTLIASAGAHGSISPTGSTTTNYGSNVSYTISADSGYHVADVLVDSVSVGATSSYTFTAVSTTHTIAASFDPNAPTITVVAPNSGVGDGGTTVMITGTHFTGTTSVTFGSTPAASFIVNSDTSITAITGERAEPGTVDVVVTTPDGSATATNAFFYIGLG